MKAVLAAIAAILVFALAILLGVGLWKFDWFVQEKNVDRQTRLNNRQQSTQEGYYDTVKADIKIVVLLDPNDPRRGAVVDEACGLTERLTPTYRTASIEAFYSQECA